MGVGFAPEFPPEFPPELWPVVLPDVLAVVAAAPPPKVPFENVDVAEVCGVFVASAHARTDFTWRVYTPGNAP